MDRLPLRFSFSVKVDMIIGARTFQNPWRASSTVCRTARSTAGARLAPGRHLSLCSRNVACDGLVIIVGVGLCRFDPVHIAAGECADHASEHLGIAPPKTFPPPAVVIVQAGS